MGVATETTYTCDICGTYTVEELGWLQLIVKEERSVCICDNCLSIISEYIKKKATTDA
jgi:hypothetical protein